MHASHMSHRTELVRDDDEIEPCSELSARIVRPFASRTAEPAPRDLRDAFTHAARLLRYGAMRLSTLLALSIVAAAMPVRAAELLQPGDAFPSWKLVDQNGAEVSSASLAGKSYLLWFYPKAMTPGCTAEGQGLRDHYAAFQTKGVEILGVSFDDPKSNAQFVVEEKFPFRLLSDRDHALANAVGAAASPDQAVASRVSYLVGPDGKVRKVYGKVDPRQHAEEVLGEL